MRRQEIPKRGRLRLYSYMEKRRVELGLTWRKVADSANITTTAIQDIRRIPDAGPPRALTMGGIDRALRWQPDSAIITFDGGTPTPLPEEASQDLDLPLPFEERLAAIERRQAALGYIDPLGPVEPGLHPAYAHHSLEERIKIVEEKLDREEAERRDRKQQLSDEKTSAPGIGIRDDLVS